MQKLIFMVWLFLLLVCGCCQNIPQSIVAHFSNGTELNRPVFGMVYSAIRNSFYLQGYGGFVYQVDADSMIVLDTIYMDFNETLYWGLGIEIDDDTGRVFVMYTNYDYTLSYALAMLDLNNKTVLSTLINNYYVANALQSSSMIYDKANKLLTARYFRTPMVGSPQLFLNIYNITSGGFNYYKQVYSSVTIYNVDTLVYYDIYSLNIFYFTSQPSNTVNFFSGLTWLEFFNPIIIPDMDTVSGDQLSNLNSSSLSYKTMGLNYVPADAYYNPTSVSLLLKPAEIVNFNSTILLQYTQSYFYALAVPIKTSQLTTTFNQDNIITITFDETSQVCFASTTDGQVLKFSYTPVSSLFNINTTQYNPSTSQLAPPGVSLDNKLLIPNKKRAYFSSSSQTGGLWSIPYGSCSSYTTCTDCAQLSDPYCGWCPLEGKCSYQSDCHNLTTWTQKSNKCPAIISTTPTEIFSTFTNLTLTVSNLPIQVYQKQYWAIQIAGSPISTATALNQTNTLTYMTFPVSSIQFLNQDGGPNLITLFYNTSNIANSTINSYNCNQNIDCSSCINSNISSNCGWCISSALCTSQTDCVDHSILTNTCPQYIQNGTIQAFSVNTTATLTQTINVGLSAAQCVFVYAGETIQINAASIISPTSLQCTFNPPKTLIANPLSSPLTVSVESSPNQPLDLQGQQNQFYYYNCSHFATCSECIGVHNATYACYWSANDNICVPGFTPVSVCPVMQPVMPLIYPTYPISDILITGDYLQGLLTVDVCEFTNFTTETTLYSQFTVIDATNAYCKTPSYPVGSSNPLSYYNLSVSGQQLGQIGLLDCSSFSNNLPGCVNQFPGVCQFCTNSKLCISQTATC